jgi:hypothetical protein
MVNRDGKDFNICSAIRTSDNKSVLIFAQPNFITSSTSRTDLSQELTESTVSCTSNDCFFRLGGEVGVTNNETGFSEIDGKRYCNAIFDCQNINVLPELVTFNKQCPVDGNRCCYDDAGQLTGQICEQGKICYNNIYVPSNFIELSNKLIYLKIKNII